MTNIVAIKTSGPKFVSNKLFQVGDKLATQLIDQGKARLATEEEVKAGRGLSKEEPKAPEPKKRGRKKASESNESTDEDE